MSQNLSKWELKGYRFPRLFGEFGTKSPRAFLDHLIFIQATSFLDLMDDVSVTIPQQ